MMRASVCHAAVTPILSFAQPITYSKTTLLLYVDYIHSLSSHATGSRFDQICCLSICRPRCWNDLKW